jgi:hypothetical protein
MLCLINRVESVCWPSRCPAGAIAKLGDFGISRVLNSETELVKTAVSTAALHALLAARAAPADGQQHLCNGKQSQQMQLLIGELQAELAKQCSAGCG